MTYNIVRKTQSTETVWESHILNLADKDLKADITNVQKTKGNYV